MAMEIFLKFHLKFKMVKFRLYFLLLLDQSNVLIPVVLPTLLCCFNFPLELIFLVISFY